MKRLELVYSVLRIEAILIQALCTELPAYEFVSYHSRKVIHFSKCAYPFISLTALAKALRGLYRVESFYFNIIPTQLKDW